MEMMADAIGKWSILHVLQAAERHPRRRPPA